jgi:hypothetical protein
VFVIAAKLRLAAQLYAYAAGGSFLVLVREGADGRFSFGRGLLF